MDNSNLNLVTNTNSNLSDIKHNEILNKIKTRQKNKIKKQIKNQTLQNDYFQKLVESENKILKGFYSRENLIEIIELYKVNYNKKK